MPEPDDAVSNREPLRVSWEDLRREFARRVRERFAGWIAEDQAHFYAQLGFALGRLDEGRALLDWSINQLPDVPGTRVRVLDVGAGNGGISLAFANSRRYIANALDVVPNSVMRSVASAARLPIGCVIATGAAMPYAAAAFDLVLLIDAVEHMADAPHVGAEIMRVLRPGGICLVSTAARLRHILRRDPHYGVPGLVLLPNVVQRFVVNNVLMRRIGSTNGPRAPAYDVEHTYLSVGEIGRLFPGAAAATGVYAVPLVSTARRLSKEWFRWRLRKFLFDHVVIQKRMEPTS